MPKNFIFNLSVLLFLLIQGIDMHLTRQFIGEDWERESFLPMSWMIKNYGIEKAVFICRIVTMIMAISVLAFKKYEIVKDFTVVLNLMYWLIMVNWLFTLGYLKW